MVDNRGAETARRRNAQNAKGKLGENRQWERGNRGEDGVWARDYMVPALTGVGLGRILNRLQVVGHGDDREQNQEEQRQGDELHSPVLHSPFRASALGKSQPQAEHQRGQQSPGEIEEQFHSQS